MRVRASTASAIRGETSSRKTKDDHGKAPRSLRTTVTLSPESQEIVGRFKSANGTSTSAAIDQIIQRSEPKPSRLKEVNGRITPTKPVLVNTYSFALSPFEADGGKTIYFAGHDQNNHPSHDMAWVFSTRLDNFLKAEPEKAGH